MLNIPKTDAFEIYVLFEVLLELPIRIIKSQSVLKFGGDTLVSVCKYIERDRRGSRDSREVDRSNRIVNGWRMIPPTIVCVHRSVRSRDSRLRSSVVYERERLEGFFHLL